MGKGSQEAVDLLTSIIDGMKLKQKVTEIAYRSDYQDYQVILDNTHHCEVREKLLIDFLATKNNDLKKQIEFLFKHPIPYEEWERPGPAPAAQNDDKIAVDDSE